MSKCIHKKDDVCTNADSPMAEDFPSEEYCESCTYHVGLSPLENLQWLYDTYAACNMRMMARSYIDSDGFLSYPESIFKETEEWKKKFEEAFLEYHRNQGELAT